MPKGKPPTKPGGKGKILGLPYWAVGAALAVLIFGYIVLSRRSSGAAPSPQSNTPDNASNTAGTPFPSSSVSGASISPGLNDSMGNMLAGLGMDPNLASTGSQNANPDAGLPPGEGKSPAKSAKRASNRAAGIQDKPPYTNSKYQPGGRYYQTGLGRDPATGRTYADNPNWKP